MISLNLFVSSLSHLNKRSLLKQVIQSATCNNHNRYFSSTASDILPEFFKSKSIFSSHVNEYVHAIEKVDCSKISYLKVNECSISKEDLNREGYFHKKKCKLLLQYDFEHRVLLTCALVHPLHFEKYGNFSNWYDINTIFQLLKEGRSLYDKEALSILNQDVINQLPFFNKIQHSPRLLKRYNWTNSIRRYEKFMTLLKKYEGVRLTPPIDVDVVWHAHMLNHKEYVRETKNYFGRVLDHKDDKEIENTSIVETRLIREIWEKYFEAEGFSGVSDGSANDGCSGCSSSSCSSCSSSCSS